LTGIFLGAANGATTSGVVLLNGSNSLAETDAAPAHLCPVCLRKLQFAVQFDPMVRYRELSRFYHRHGWADEAAWADRQLAKGGAAGSQQQPKESSRHVCAGAVGRELSAGIGRGAFLPEGSVFYCRKS
jgi:hypothetical protein